MVSVFIIGFQGRGGGEGRVGRRVGRREGAPADTASSRGSSLRSDSGSPKAVPSPVCSPCPVTRLLLLLLCTDPRADRAVGVRGDRGFALVLRGDAASQCLSVRVTRASACLFCCANRASFAAAMRCTCLRVSQAFTCLRTIEYNGLGL